MPDILTPKKSGISLCITALILSLAFIPVFAKTQTHQLTIKIINAKTHQPIPDEQLNVALKIDQIGSVPMATDKHGVIVIDYKKATILRILSNMYADCRPRSELYTNYSITTILRTGITTGNLCSSANPAPKPGQLLLFEVPKSFIPLYPAPPNSNIPHSDENPHSPPN